MTNEDNLPKADGQPEKERPGSSDLRSGLTRRDAIKLVGAGAALAAIPAISTTAHAKATHIAAPKPIRPYPYITGPNLVDLYVKADPVQFDASGNGTLNITVGNFGSPTRGEIQVLVLSPFYANLASPLPSGVTALFQDPRPYVPEVAEIMVPPGLAGGFAGAVSYSIPLVTTGGLVVPNAGRVFANIVDPTVDTEANLMNNTKRYEVLFANENLGSPSGNPVNLYFTYSKPLLYLNQTSNLAITVNTLTGTPSADPYFTYVTPHLVKLDTSRPMPGASPDIVFNPPNAGYVPQIVVTKVEGLRFNLFGLGSTLNFPITPIIKGGLAGGMPTRTGRGMVAPAPGDYHPDPRVAISAIDVLQLS